jgi:hypothetical protein
MTLASFQEALAEDRRCGILRLLVEAEGEANESVLRTGLAMLGHTRELTKENVRSDLNFLSDCGLVTLRWFAEKVCVAKITRRGVEVAEGKVRVEGVKKPALGD